MSRMNNHLSHLLLATLHDLITDSLWDARSKDKSLFSSAIWNSVETLGLEGVMEV